MQGETFPLTPGGDVEDFWVRLDVSHLTWWWRFEQNGLAGNWSALPRNRAWIRHSCGAQAPPPSLFPGTTFAHPRTCPPALPPHPLPNPWNEWDQPVQSHLSAEAISGLCGLAHLCVPAQISLRRRMNVLYGTFATLPSRHERFILIQDTVRIVSYLF